jgi:hypothetical protein
MGLEPQVAALMRPMVALMRPMAALMRPMAALLRPMARHCAAMGLTAMGWETRTIC